MKLFFTLHIKLPITRYLLSLCVLQSVKFYIEINISEHPTFHPEITICIIIRISRLCDFIEGESESEGEGSIVHCYRLMIEYSVRAQW